MEEIYGYIYKIVNKINSKVYIGQTNRSVQIRFEDHISRHNCEDYVIYRAMRKYGVENFYVEQIDTCYSEDELNDKEEYWVDKYRSFIGFSDCKGYNMTLGGEGTKGGYILTPDDVVKIKEMLRDTSLSCKDIGKLFNTSGRNVSSIHEGRIYSYIYVDGHTCGAQRSSSNGFNPNKLHATDLTIEDVMNIKETLRDTDLSYQDIANMFETNTIVVGKIYRGERWSWLDVKGFTPWMERNNKFKKTKRMKKPSTDEVVEIKKLLMKSELKQQEIADMFDLSRTMITNILTGKKYADVEVEGFTPVKNNGRVSFALGEDAVLNIKKLAMTNNYYSKDLCEMYNISLTALWDILNEENYKTVKLEGYSKDKVMLKSNKDKLDKIKVKEIRRLYNEGMARKQIALDFGISETTVRNVCNYKTWKNVV